jgi:hypothetical protein
MASEGDYLRLLRRPDLPVEALQLLLEDSYARSLHTVRRAIAAHPRTPRHAALTLVSSLYWKDLARLSADSRVHPEVRRAADRDLSRRLPEMALAEKMDLARSVGRGTLLALRFDPDPRVLLAVLDNRFATEIDITAVAARRQTPPGVLEAIASHPRWGLRPALRSALLQNPGLPTAVALSLLSRASARDLEGLLTAPGVSRLLKACAERVLARRDQPH